jgi:signal transduction histidine kinase
VSTRRVSAPCPPDAGEREPLAAFLGELAAAVARPAERSRGRARLCAALGELGGGWALLCTAQPDGTLLCEAGTGDLAPLEGDLVPLQGTLEGDVFRAGTPLVTANLRTDPRAFLAMHRGLPNTPAAVLPLVAGGHVEGVALLARQSRGAEFAAAELEVLMLAAGLVAGALRGFAEAERMRASRAVVEAWRAAHARDGELTKSLLRAVRHELNTPVAVIQGNLQLCPSPDPAEWKVPPADLWATMRAEAGRLEELSRLLHALDETGAPVVLDAQGRFVRPSRNGEGHEESSSP